MARPAFLSCDADALIQLFIAGELRPLKLLKNAYSIQPVIAPEVEIELHSNRRFGARIGPDLRKALANDLIKTLDRQTLEIHYATTNQLAGATAVANGTFAQIQSLGRAFEKHIDFGEAYTHAGALVLNVPAMSNDLSALEALAQAGHTVPSTVLRSWDLIALSFQVANMSADECDEFRKAMEAEKEYAPKCFRGKSYADGLRNFSARMADGSVAPVGSSIVDSAPFATRLIL
jgi:hypothetical protein